MSWCRWVRSLCGGSGPQRAISPPLENHAGIAHLILAAVPMRGRGTATGVLLGPHCPSGDAIRPKTRPGAVHANLAFEKVST